MRFRKKSPHTAETIQWGLPFHLLEGRKYTQIIWNSCTWESGPYFHTDLFIQSHIYSSMDLSVFIFTWGYSLTAVLLLSCSDYFSFGYGEGVSWLLWPFIILPPTGACVVFTKISLFSGTTRYSRLIIYIFSQPTIISCFSKELWSFFLENGIKNQELRTRCAHCHWGVTASRSS